MHTKVSIFHRSKFSLHSGYEYPLAKFSIEWGTGTAGGRSLESLLHKPLKEHCCITSIIFKIYTGPRGSATSTIMQALEP
eukprot:SAG31_NODE_11669_length_1008_cov_0.891089_1_plen_79_part_10